MVILVREPQAPQPPQQTGIEAFGNCRRAKRQRREADCGSIGDKPGKPETGPVAKRQQTLSKRSMMNPVSWKDIIAEDVWHPFPEAAIQRVHGKHIHLYAGLLQPAHVAGEEGADLAGELVGE